MRMRVEMGNVFWKGTVGSRNEVAEEELRKKLAQNIYRTNYKVRQTRRESSHQAFLLPHSTKPYLPRTAKAERIIH